MVVNILVLPLTEKDREWAKEVWNTNWSGETVVTRGRLHHLSELKGLVATIDNQSVGLLTFHIEEEQLEVVSLDSTLEGVGIGTELIENCIIIARENQCERIWLVTTNDNTEALRFYQRRGFRIRAIHKGAVEKSRELKPSIPTIGNHGIPIRDEIELELTLENDAK